MAIEAPQPTVLETLDARVHAPARRVLVLRGSLSLLFGLLALPWPGMTQLLLVAMFTAWMLIAGAGTLAAALRHRATLPGWRLTALLGAGSFLVGVASLFYPGATLLALLLLVGMNALVTGILDVALGLARRASASPGRPRLRILAGVLSIAFGLLVLAFPQPAALALVWIVAGYAILHGVPLLLHAFERPATFSSG